MTKSLTIFAGLGLLISAVSSLGQDNPYIVLPVSPDLFWNSCSIVRTRDEMKAALNDLGYTSPNLPQIDFGKRAAVIIASGEGSSKPSRYLLDWSSSEGGQNRKIIAITVELEIDSFSSKNYLMVMAIRREDGAAPACNLREVYDNENPGYLPPPVQQPVQQQGQQTPGQPVGNGGSANTNGMPVQKQPY